MDPCVRASGRAYPDRFARQRGYRFFKLLLNRGGVLLVLESVVVRTLVFDYQCEANFAVPMFSLPDQLH